MKNHILTLGLLFLVFGQVKAQNLPSDRASNWFNVGSEPAFTPAVTLAINSFGADSTGVVGCDAAFNAAKNALNGPGRILFGAGSYKFNKQINLPDSIILEGNHDPLTGFSNTTLLLNSGATQHGIAIQGNIETPVYATAIAPSKGEQRLQLVEQQPFSVNDWLLLVPTDDSLLVTSSWALAKTGQLLKVRFSGLFSVFLDRNIRRNYDPGRLPLVRKINPKQQVHLRCINLERLDAATSNAANVFFRYAVNCSMEGVRSVKCNYAHVDIRESARVTVKNSFFTLSLNYGGGGKGYGVMIEAASGECLVTGNVFDHLRHSMILQSGANGNVLAYNYSKDPFWTETFLPANSAGDLVLHGNYPYANLFEGNVVQHIVIDNSHGKNGPLNTFFRNRAEGYGLFMNSNPASDGQNFLGNQITNTSGGFLGAFTLAGTDHFSIGNSKQGVLTPVGSVEPASNSLFGYDFGTFYDSLGMLPPIQNGLWSSATPLNEPAYRYQILSKTALCDDITYSGGQQALLKKQSKGLLTVVWPNPFDVKFQVHAPTFSIGTARIFNALGGLVGEQKFESSIFEMEVSELPEGLYFLVLQHKDQYETVLLQKL